MEAPIETARARSPHAPALALLALAFALVAAALSPSPAQASAADRIHIVSISGSDAILIESDGVFGMVDSGEDNDYPSGDDPRYPSRPGIVAGEGFEDEVISYMRSVGVTQDNFEFYIGTHPHSDRIGSADEIIREFHPKRVYTPEYRDEFISDDRALWDNLYVYDNLIQAARDVGASLILNLDPNAPVAPNPEADLPTSPSVSNDDQGASAPDQAQEPLPEAEPMTAEEVARAFGVDPTDPANPNNPETLPHGYVMVPTSDDPNEVFNTDPDSATTGNPSFSLGSLTIEIMNYGDDYKYHPVPDANYFSWGVKVTAANGRSAFLAGDICNYNGDESRLAPRVGHVDLLKMAHHGLSGSNTPAYLETLHPSIAIQTADFEWLPMSVVDTLCSLGTRHYTTPEARERGIGAIVTTLSDSSVKVNVASDEVVYRTRESTPYLTAYANGLKTILNGWILFNERWYWFDGGSSAVEDRWLSYGGYWYYLGSSGSMVASDWASDGNHWWLLDEQGRMITTSGWQSVGGAWYWLNAGGAMASDEWVWDGRDWYRLAPDGAMQTGWYSDGSHWYYLDPGDGGRMKAGWLLLDGEWYHLASDGSMETGWLKEGSSWYHLASDGSMDVGWYSDGSRWYYLDPEDGGRMAEGWLSLDGEWYWLEPGHGGMASGEWVWDGWDWYHVAPDGAMDAGWYSDGSRWYYLDPANGGRMAEGWLSLDGEWYHLASDGSMETGWLKEGSSWYHLASDGSMDTGWLSEGSYWYYLDPANGGRMATGVRVVDGVTYYFDLDGRSRPGLDRASLLSAVDSASGSKNTSVVNGTLSQSTIDRLDADLATIRTGGHEVGYLMIDLTTASVVSANASGNFYCASTIKGPYVCAAASGWPSKAVNWKSTMYDAISWSSNDAYRQLRSAFGSGVMSEFMNEADVSYFYPSTMWPDIRPRDLSKLWVRTYDYFRSTDANSDWVQDYFFHTKNSFIDAALGGSHHVYSKAGWIWESSRYYVYNDAAIVDDGWHPYVMVILSTANSSSSSALQTLATDLEAAHNELLSL